MGSFMNHWGDSINHKLTFSYSEIFVAYISHLLLKHPRLIKIVFTCHVIFVAGSSQATQSHKDNFIGAGDMTCCC